MSNNDNNAAEKREFVQRMLCNNGVEPVESKPFCTVANRNKPE